MCWLFFSGKEFPAQQSEARARGMAEPASLPLDPAVLETEVFGTIVARLVAGFASLASSPTRTSVAWSQVRVSVNLTRRVPEGDSPPPGG